MGGVLVPEEYRIGELAEKAGVTKRTIHYYISKGLIPPPEGAGVGSTYNEEHFVKVLLVKKLQEQYLPLDKIRHIISGLSTGEVKRVLEEGGEADCRISTNSITDSGDDEAPRYKQKVDNYTEDMAAVPCRQMMKNPGTEYIRFDLAFGIELHCPADLIEKYGDLINAVERYARKLFEGK
jgi:DNA-binding transcriptional MerR regulator